MIKKILIASLIAALFCACKTEQKARKAAQEFYKSHPGELAGQCVEMFPPKIEYKKGEPVYIPGDTITIKGDSIPCPEIPAANGQPARSGGKVKCPDSKIIRDTVKIVDTVQIEDRARVTWLEYRLDTTARRLVIKSDQLEEMTADRDDWKSKAKTRNFWIWGLVILIVGATILRIKKNI